MRAALLLPMLANGIRSMWLISRVQFSFATWTIPLACVLFGSGLGVSRALLACEAPITSTHVTEGVSSIDDAYAEEQCPDESEQHLADLDGDGTVDVFDLVLFFADFGVSGPVAADINDDGSVDTADFTALIRNLNS